MLINITLDLCKFLFDLNLKGYFNYIKSILVQLFFQSKNTQYNNDKITINFSHINIVYQSTSQAVGPFKLKWNQQCFCNLNVNIRCERCCHVKYNSLKKCIWNAIVALINSTDASFCYVS